MVKPRIITLILFILTTNLACNSGRKSRAFKHHKTHHIQSLKKRHHQGVIDKASFLDCTNTECFPPTGDLLLGRRKFLYADSTCGSTEPTRYCVHSQLVQQQHAYPVEAFFHYLSTDRAQPNRCFVCDSRKNTIDPKLNHGIENVVMDQPVRVNLRGREIITKWWQSANGVENVYIQLDLEALFTMTVIIMRFKNYPPAAMKISASHDFGHSWKTLSYYAYNCALSFPGVPALNTRDFNKPFCTSRYSGLEYPTGAELYYAPLTQIKNRSISRAELQDSLKFTNLRITFSKLHVLDGQSKVVNNYTDYYAVNEIKVYGSCFCNGHASRCKPIQSVQYDKEHVASMFHAVCQCEHFSTGDNCERCLDMFNDRPWMPAQSDKANECKRCECNNHAHSCYFDPLLYIETNRTSGGVCINCLHNTAGKNCEKCATGFQRDPQLPHIHPHSCQRCNCDQAGSIFIANETCSNSNCRCKLNVEGPQCTNCKIGYWQLRASNPAGCRKCPCEPTGTVQNKGCNRITGVCAPCKRFVAGKRCDRCKPGYYDLSASNNDGCEPCNCHKEFSYSSYCDIVTGQCSCKPHITGLKCDQIEANFFCPHIDSLKYEAEYSEAISSFIKIDDRLESSGSENHWTGAGYMRIYNGASLKFRLDLEHKSGVYDVLLRYESLVYDWKDVRVTIANRGMDFGKYGPRELVKDANKICLFDGREQRSVEERRILLKSNGRSQILFSNYCFKSLFKYELEIDFNYDQSKKHSVYDLTSALSTPTLSVDSLVLIPNLRNAPSLTGNAQNKTLQSCRENYFKLPHNNDKECSEKICNVINQEFGFSQCQCSPIGSVNGSCDPYGGQCPCKPNVIGKNCDKCKPNAWGFSHEGCQACNCDPSGSKDDFCNSNNGKCNCYENKTGNKCDRCVSGYFGFPNCQRCECNGYSRECTSTGVCRNCGDYTTGKNCGRCKDGYFGLPSEGIACKKCSCPGINGTNFANTCHYNNKTGYEVCDCITGYTGDNCEKCQKLYFGEPSKANGSCQFCECNGNIDANDPEGCDSTTGECKKCQLNTEGFHCDVCKSGFYGNAIEHTCKPCTCNKYGTVNNTMCHKTNGACDCLPNVTGQNCDECATNYWNLKSSMGCSKCDCDTTGTIMNAKDCDESTGQCLCNIDRAGRRCDECPVGSWGSPLLTGCQVCQCNLDGVEEAVCDKRDGQCLCKSGVTGEYCDHCARGSLGQPPGCQSCGKCFTDWDRKVSIITSELDEMKKRSSNFFTLIGVGKINFLEFTTKMRNTEDIIEDSMRLLNVSYNQKNITEALRDYEVIWTKSTKNRDLMLKYLNEIQIWMDSMLFYKKLQTTYELIKNDTNQLLRRAFNLRERDIEGAQQSLEISLVVSNRASLLVNDSLENFDQTIKQVLFDIENKIVNFSTYNTSSFGNEQKNTFTPIRLVTKSELGRLSVNASVSELNRVVCGTFSLSCASNNVCGAVLCGQCGFYAFDKYEHVYKRGNFFENHEENCASGMQSSFKRFAYFNDSFHALYGKKEAQMKQSIKLRSNIKIDLKQGMDQILTLNKTLIERYSTVKKNQTLVSDMLNFTSNLENEMELKYNKIQTICGGVLEKSVVFDEDAFNKTLDQIVRLSNKSVVTVADFELISARLQLELIKSISNRVNSLGIDSNETLFAKQKEITVNSWKKALDEHSGMKTKLEGLRNSTGTLMSINIQSNKSLVKLRNDLTEEEMNIKEIEKNKLHPKSRLIEFHGKNMLNALKFRLLISSKKLNDLENFYGIVLDNLNRSNDLANKRKIELLINLKNQIMTKVKSLGRKNAKIGEIRGLNYAIKMRMQAMKFDINDLRKLAKNLRKDIKMKVDFSKNCQ